MTMSVAPEDLEKFGFIPELIGRFSSTIQLSELAVNDFLKILNNPVQSPIMAYRNIFEKHGLRLTFDDAAIDLMAEEAKSMGLGARSLHRLVSNSLREVSWRLDELRSLGICEIRVGKNTILSSSSPELIHGPPAFEYRAEELRVTVFIDQIRQKLDRETASVQGSEGSPQSDSNATGEFLPTKGLSNTKGWTNEQILKRYSEFKDLVGFKELEGNAAKWWAAYETEVAHRPALLLRIVEELWLREATLTAFFRSFVYSKTTNIQGNLEYLCFRRERDTWENRKAATSSIVMASQDSRSTEEVRQLLCFSESSLPARLFWELIEDDYHRIGISWFKALGTVADVAVTNFDEFLDLVVRAQTLSPAALVFYQRYLGPCVREVIEQNESNPPDPQWRWRGEGFPIISEWSFVYRIYRLVAEEIFFIRLRRRYQVAANHKAERIIEIVELIRVEIEQVVLRTEQLIDTRPSSNLLLDCLSEIQRRPYIGEIYQPDHARGVVRGFSGALTKAIPSWTPGMIVGWCNHLVASMAYGDIDTLGALQLVMRVSRDGIANYWNRSVAELETLVPGARRAWNEILGSDYNVE